METNILMGYGMMLPMSILIILVPYYRMVTSNPSDITAYVVVMIIGASLLLFSIFVLYAANPTTDRTFENGVTSMDHNIFEYWRNKTFTPFNQITMIGLGTGIVPIVQERFKFIAIYTKGRRRNTTTFTDRFCQEGFFEKLEEILTVKCPNIPWVPMDWKPP